jgi:hypothetical protein
MTESAEGGRQPLEPDPYVERLLPDPSNVAPGTRFVGFLGKSNRDGYWRLYLSPALDDYLEIAASDVISAYKIDGAISPLGGTVLSVKPEAQVVRMRVDATEARNAFLKGQITGRFMARSRPQMPLTPRAAAKLGLGGGLNDWSDGFGCWLSDLIVCASHDPDDTVCTAQSMRPGTADSCGQCTTNYMCPDPFRF